MTEGDSRFASADFRPLLELQTGGRWPGRDQVFVLSDASLLEATLPQAPTLRALALAPEKYEGRSVTISGRFRGRNLLGDLAAPLPTPTKWDFVLQSADAAIWISGLRPRGRGFELDPCARVDTGRWVQVTGTVRREGSRVWIEAREIELAAPPGGDGRRSRSAGDPARAATDRRLQHAGPRRGRCRRWSRRARAVLARHGRPLVQGPRARELPAGAAGRGGDPATVRTTTFAFNYNVGARGIELKFTKPLERFQTVKIELLEGITAIGGDPLRPWTLTFTTGRMRQSGTMTITTDESARLAALQRYRILDTDPERAFDDLTLLASHICGTPIALISSSTPTGSGSNRASASRSPRPRAACRSAPTPSSSTTCMSSPTRAGTPSFRDNPFVTAATASASTPARRWSPPHGHALGTLCVLDKVPRTLSDRTGGGPAGAAAAGRSAARAARQSPRAADGR